MTQHPKCVLNQHHHLTAQSIAWRLFSGTSHQQDGDNWGYSSKNSSGYSTKATNAQMIPFSWWLIFMASEKKSENHHINGAVAPRAVERGVDDARHVCDVSHKTVLWPLLMFQGGSSVKAKCSQDSTGEQGTEGKLERFLESQKQGPSDIWGA